jgi:hypothetical protein
MSNLSELKKLLDTPGKPATIKRFRTNDLIVLDPSCYNCEGVIFEDCNFKGLEINGIDFKLGAQFIRTRIEDLSIRECIATEYVMEFNKNDNSLEFINCDFTNLFLITSCEFERGLQIRNSRITKSIDLINNKANTINIIDSKTLSAFLSNSKCTSHIRFYNSEFRDSVRFENNNCSYFIFMDSIFKSDVWIWEGNIRGVIIDSGSYAGPFKIEAVNCLDQISIIDGDFKKDCNIILEDVKTTRIGSCPKLHIASSRFLEGLLFNGKTKTKVIQ